MLKILSFLIQCFYTLTWHHPTWKLLQQLNIFIFTIVFLLTKLGIKKIEEKKNKNPNAPFSVSSSPQIPTPNKSKFTFTSEAVV
jgi:hypothetical protein